MRELYILLPALAYGNKSMEGKTQLSVNLGPSERELISPPAANYCHEIKCFVLFGECQPFHGKTKEGKRKRKRKKKASRCRCWNLFARPLYQRQEKSRLFYTAGVQIAQLAKRQLAGGVRTCCYQLRLFLTGPKGDGDATYGQPNSQRVKAGTGVGNSSVSRGVMF